MRCPDPKATFAKKPVKDPSQYLSQPLPDFDDEGAHEGTYDIDEGMRPRGLYYY